ncbi:MAG TPA: hypothetical protein VFP16_07315 [Vicinamibacterales bacterium]|nr:hypothetical protein [Vicinamibacterales bacterium]
MRLHSSAVFALIFATLGLWAVDITGQGKPSYAPPRTPWGDPDLQGTYTNKYEQSTPLERPDEFAGRRVEDVSGAELADVLAKRNKQVVDRAAGVGPLQFRDPLEVTKGSRAWLIVEPPDGKVPPMTPAARQRIGPSDPFQDTGIQGIVNARVREASSFDPNSSFRSIDDFDLWERCITRGVPGAMMPHILGNSYEIVQAPGLVAIRYELVHDVRVIPLDPSTRSGSSRAESRDDGRPYLPGAIELEMGAARGHWDGNTLVVESTNYKDRSTYRNANAATLRLIERFTRASANRIEWSVTVNDPATWTKPWTFSMPLTKTDTEPVLEFACHEGNYALPHILSGARAAEASAQSSRQH